VLKALALVLTPRLPASPPGSHLPEHACVVKTDVQGDYASMDHLRLMEALEKEKINLTSIAPEPS
jgi:hypothetical protein